MTERTFRVFIKDRPNLLITCPRQRLDLGAVTTDIRACWEGEAQAFTSISKAVKALGDASINPNNQCFIDAARTIKLGDLVRNLDKIDFVELHDPKLVAARKLLEQKTREHDQAEAAAQAAARAAATKLAEKSTAAASVRALEETARLRSRLTEELKRKTEAERQAEVEERQAAAKRARCAEETKQTERRLAELEAAA